jgi:hypothetical protein
MLSWQRGGNSVTVAVRNEEQDLVPQAPNQDIERQFKIVRDTEIPRGDGL